MRLACAFGLLLLLTSPQPLWAADGRGLYTGTATMMTSVRIGAAAVTVPAERFACVTCHGSDGRGGREGADPAPSIDGRELAVSTDRRPAYTPQALARVLTEGIAPDGRKLSAAMPRFDYLPEEADALFRYLGRIAQEQRAGVEPSRVRFTVTVPQGRRSAGEAIARAFGQAWRALGDPEPHGRRPDLAVVEVGASDTPALKQLAETSFALLLSAPAGDAPLMEEAARAGLPSVMPFAQPEGTESPEHVRAAFASVRDELATTLNAGRGGAIVVDESAQRWGSLVQREGWRMMTGPEFAAADPRPETVLLLARGSAFEAFSRLDLRGVTVYRRGADAARESSLPLRQAGAKVLVSVPYALAEEGSHAREIQLVRTASRIVRDALAGAGRELTRRGFMEAIGRSSTGEAQWPVLDFRRFPLSGTSSVSLLTIP